MLIWRGFRSKTGPFLGLKSMFVGQSVLRNFTLTLLSDHFDTCIEAKWKRKSARFAVECKALSTVTRYTVMQRGDLLTVYCPEVEMLLERLPGSQSDRFPNLELLETEDEAVYFDARQEDGFWWASPLQVYMELMVGDKRDQETAGQLKALILNDAGLVQQ